MLSLFRKVALPVQNAMAPITPFLLVSTVDTATVEYQHWYPLSHQRQWWWIIPMPPNYKPSVMKAAPPVDADDAPSVIAVAHPFQFPDPTVNVISCSYPDADKPLLVVILPIIQTVTSPVLLNVMAPLTKLHYTTKHYTTLHYTTLHYTTLKYTILYYNV
jgi:hypothetical protein